jgi:hypothetical protein
MSVESGEKWPPDRTPEERQARAQVELAEAVEDLRKHAKAARDHASDVVWRVDGLIALIAKCQLMIPLDAGDLASITAAFKDCHVPFREAMDSAVDLGVKLTEFADELDGAKRTAAYLTAGDFTK